MLIAGRRRELVAPMSASCCSLQDGGSSPRAETKQCSTNGYIVHLPTNITTKNCQYVSDCMQTDRDSRVKAPSIPYLEIAASDASRQRARAGGLIACSSRFQRRTDCVSCVNLSNLYVQGQQQHTTKPSKMMHKLNE
jgi:hypothetical protein